MSSYWKQFKSSRTALLNYFLAHTGLLLMAIAAIVFFPELTFRKPLPFSMHLFIIPLSIFVGLKVTTWMHNCMHFNFRWGNRILGELTAFYALMSFGLICDLHTLHHSYPDTEKDPHNPAGIGFWNLFFTSQFRGVGIIEEKFYEFHGKTLTNTLIFKANIFLHFLGNVLRLAIWYLALGPLFYSVYLPGFLAYLFVFNHLNYGTHITDKNGHVQVLNLNSNLYYQIINWICDGIYFHANHHIYPRRTNPSRPSGRELWFRPKQNVVESPFRPLNKIAAFK